VNGAAVFEAVATANSGVLQTLSTLSKHVIRSLRGQQFSAHAETKAAAGDSLGGLQAAPKPARTDETEPGREPTVEISAAARMEDAILSEAEHPEADVLDELSAATQAALEIPWGELEADGEPIAAVQLDSEFSIASVGEATRSGERGVRIPLVVSDKTGRRSNLVLTVHLDPLPDGDSG